MRSLSAAIAALALAASSVCHPQAPDANPGRGLAATCTGCHGTNGVSEGEIESLAGMAKDDIVRKVQDFKTGRKPGTVMPQLAKGYTDLQIELAASWFSMQKGPK